MKELRLTRGLVALVDDEDFDRVSQFKYRAIWNGTQFYAMRNSSRRDGKRTGIYLHRELLDAPPGVEGHHKNGNALDCRRLENLELRTPQQNTQGFRRKVRGCSSRFRGVRAKDGRWEAWIQPKGNRKYLGRFDVEEDAARAYDKAAIELFGEFASPNFSAVSPSRQDSAAVGPSDFGA